MESCVCFKLKVCKFMKILVQKYSFVSTGTQLGHGHKFYNCLSHSGTLGNNAYIISMNLCSFPDDLFICRLVFISISAKAT